MVRRRGPEPGAASGAGPGPGRRCGGCGRRHGPRPAARPAAWRASRPPCAPRMTAIWASPRRAMNRLASREVADAAATTCEASFSSAQLTVASISARPTPWRRNSSRTWRCRRRRRSRRAPGRAGTGPGGPPRRPGRRCAPRSSRWSGSAAIRATDAAASLGTVALNARSAPRAAQTSTRSSTSSGPASRRCTGLRNTGAPPFSVGKPDGRGRGATWPGERRPRRSPTGLIERLRLPWPDWVAGEGTGGEDDR